MGRGAAAASCADPPERPRTSGVSSSRPMRWMSSSALRFRASISFRWRAMASSSAAPVRGAARSRACSSRAAFAARRSMAAKSGAAWRSVPGGCFPIYQNKAVWAVRHGAAHLQPGKPGSVRPVYRFWLLPNGTVRRKGTGALPEARPGAAEYGNQSIIRQQKTRPAGRIYFGCGRVFIVEEPPVLHMRAKPCITGMRARWHKYGPPAAKILLPAARKRAYSSIVRCFPALFSSIRF